MPDMNKEVYGSVVGSTSTSVGLEEIARKLAFISYTHLSEISLHFQDDRSRAEEIAAKVSAALKDGRLKKDIEKLPKSDAKKQVEFFISDSLKGIKSNKEEVWKCHFICNISRSSVKPVYWERSFDGDILLREYYTLGNTKNDIVDILENMDKDQLVAVFNAAVSIAGTDSHSRAVASLTTQIPEMSEGQVKLMSLLAEHFRFADWKPGELYQGYKKSGDPIEFTKRVYADRLTGNFAVSDIRPYDPKLYQALRNKKDEVLVSINLPKLGKLLDRMRDDGYLAGASSICRILESMRKTKRTLANH